MIELEKAKSNLEELGLLNAAVFIDAILERAQHANATYIEFLNGLLEAELSERQRRNIEVRSKLARLPYRKTLSEFDFTFQPSIDEKLIRELATMAFVYRAENVIFLGPPGVGKTHLAVGLAIEALSQGMSVYFTRLSRLIEDLKKANKENRLEKRMRIYTGPKLLIIDEVGYLPLDDLGANLFFQLISARYERGSIILTSNKGFGEWGELMGDTVLATAVLDRLLHHAHIINIRGNSYRLKDRLKTGLYGNPHNNA
ncbi:IS21-like element helper ATPase IstB [Thermovenabulum gondwanense]|uniref:Chromosomal replication initiator protein DnaA n=1 Tax=Thermovenabulum gondwanense TaxID=520767 RepID=A0A162MMJ1_9FIRM|nr:IS21-like element helper ATPase IstB [Thermovenabulum gondwanense]KYO66714.1 Chromosomal replication initiator protein DnaA [Thermovenabulum gondwanense]